MERPTVLMDWEAQYPKDVDFLQIDQLGIFGETWQVNSKIYVRE